ncbi:hypothetical protein [Streptomyces sp. A5-4]|uniref:hypothetical protein n=1 Tax=Streptomyces sp. A5-4 TaxID=3384771 RepID=UPI003DA8E0A8
MASDALLRTRQAIQAAGCRPRPEMWGGPTDTGIPVAASCQHSGDQGGPIVIIPKPKG